MLISPDLKVGVLRTDPDPRTQLWDEHFEMQPDGLMVGKTPIGRVTVRILQMNKPRRVDMRRMLIQTGLM